MNAIYFAAAAGLPNLTIGIGLVNVVSTPCAAQIGILTTGFGVVKLVAVAIRQLLAAAGSKRNDSQSQKGRRLSPGTDKQQTVIPEGRRLHFKGNKNDAL
jgi:hypothetical protein